MKARISTLLILLKVLPVVLLSGCSAVQLVNSVSKVYSVEVQTDLAFGSNSRDKMDIYRPTEPPSANKQTPVVVFFYGGSWNRGEKSEYEFVGRKLASMGYIVAIPNYRIYPEVVYPDFLKDGAKAVKVFLDELNSNTYSPYNPAKQLIFMGHSAGAYNAAMIAMDDRWLGRENLNRRELVKGLIGMAGAYNIYPIKVEEVRPVFNHPNYPPQSQPIDYVGESNVPTLLLAPETDELVSLERNTFSLAKALKASGTPVEVVTVPDTDHISLIGTLSPVLFFKGDSVSPLKSFIDRLQTN